MRKFAILLLATTVVFCMFGCSIENVIHSCYDFLEAEEIEQNYVIYTLKNDQYGYHLLVDGEIFYCETTENYPEINMIYDNILEIRVGYGTGTSVAKYCNIKEKVVSSWYDDVVFYYEHLIFRLEYDKNKTGGNKHSLVVSNMFTGECKQTIFFEDISDEPMPINQIQVIDNSVEIEYFTIDGSTKKKLVALATN